MLALDLPQFGVDRVQLGAGTSEGAHLTRILAAALVDEHGQKDESGARGIAVGSHKAVRTIGEMPAVALDIERRKSHIG
jgi:hypothetical protein